MSKASRRIKLVVTGDLEAKVLAASLRRQFPSSCVDGVPVSWQTPRKVHGATTHRLRPGAPPSNPMRTLAKAVLAEALIGDGGRPADLVVAIDDLELHNVDQPDAVCAAFRAAMAEEAPRFLRDRSAHEQAEARGLIRSRCSFHLVSPMIESYFFGETDALLRVGCGRGVTPLVRSSDWEDFWVTDPAFVARCEAENEKKAAPPLANNWWREERHAKHYLESLVAQAGRFYEETAGGAEALSTLDWPFVPREAVDCPLIRALFADLADFFGVHSPLGEGTQSPHTYSGLPGPRSSRLLRNM